MTLLSFNRSSVRTGVTKPNLGPQTHLHDTPVSCVTLNHSLNLSDPVSALDLGDLHEGDFTRALRTT